MTENKTKPTKVSVTAFIEAIEDETRRADAKTLMKLMKTATGENPSMWGPSIIGFGNYHYKYESGREGDMPIACFSPRKFELVIYGMAGVTGSEALLAKLGKHSMGKGCVYIKKLADVNQEVLESMIRNSVTAARARHSN